MSFWTYNKTNQKQFDYVIIHAIFSSLKLHPLSKQIEQLLFDML